MKTNIFYSTAIFMLAFWSFLGNAHAENTTGNVQFDFWPNSQSKQATMRFYFNENDTTLTPVFYWDTIPNSYRFKHVASTFTSKSGFAEWQFNYVSCKNYFGKVEFTDLRTGNSYQLFNGLSTPGDLAPTFKSVYAAQTGYNYSVLSFNLDAKCNEARFKASISKKGKMPVEVSTQYLFGNQNIKLPFYGLDPNEWYEVQLEAETFVGKTYYTYSFMTISNLLPFTESLRATTNGNPYSATLYGDVDPKNTNSTQWRVEFGTDIHMEEASLWFSVYQKGSHSFDIHYLKPNTQYFWRSVVQNEFGRFDGQVKTFKTDALAGITDLKSNDKLQVASRPGGGITIFTERDATVTVSSVTGQLIGAYKVGGIMQINDLTTGIYVVSTVIEGQALAKKTIVF